MDQALENLRTWWASVTPEFAFLLALPFVIGALGLIGDCVRRRRSKPPRA